MYLDLTSGPASGTFWAMDTVLAAVKLMRSRRVDGQNPRDAFRWWHREVRLVVRGHYHPDHVAANLQHVTEVAL